MFQARNPRHLHMASGKGRSASVGLVLLLRHLAVGISHFGSLCVLLNIMGGARPELSQRHKACSRLLVGGGERHLSTCLGMLS
jgi:hypothetical protein